MKMPKNLNKDNVYLRFEISLPKDMLGKLLVSADKIIDNIVFSIAHAIEQACSKYKDKKNDITENNEEVVSEDNAKGETI